MFNWLDWILVPAVMFFVWEGWLAGGIKVLSGMISFLGSLWLAVKYHSAAGRFVGEKFGISRVWVDVVGYLIVAVTAETIISIALHLLLQKLTGKRTQSQWNRAIGAAANGIKGLVLAAFALLVIIALPLKGNIRRDIRSSILGSRLVAAAQKYGGQVETSINEAAAEAVRFLTIKPQSTEIIPLNLPLETCRLNVGEEEEWKMLGLINRERENAGSEPLGIDRQITAVAREYGRDMFERKYFSHYSPEGTDAGERLEKGGVVYALAGENLAYAPDLETAHKGLMESEGHRKNILEPRFGRVGIGVIDAGICGMMFVQNFAD